MTISRLDDVADWMSRQNVGVELQVAFLGHRACALEDGMETRFRFPLLNSSMNSVLVIGARGHSALYEGMSGSRADRIMQIAQCPVPVVK